MLQKYTIAQKKSIHPFGGTVYAFDKDFSWKKKRLEVVAKSASNVYNLVSLKSSAKEGKQFVIDKVCQTTHHDNGMRATLSDQVTEKTQSSDTALAPPASVPNSLEECINPQYINICQPIQKRSQPQLIPAVSTYSEDDGYENWPTMGSAHSNL